MRIVSNIAWLGSAVLPAFEATSIPPFFEWAHRAFERVVFGDGVWRSSHPSFLEVEWKYSQSAIVNSAWYSRKLVHFKSIL